MEGRILIKDCVYDSLIGQCVSCGHVRTHDESSEGGT